MQFPYTGQIGIWSVGFCEFREMEELRKNPQSKANNKLNPNNYGTGQKQARATLIGGGQGGRSASLQYNL